jgi:tight adherence protein B
MDPLLIAIAVVVALTVFTVVLGVLSPRKKAEGGGGSKMAARLDAFRPDYNAPVTSQERVAKLRQRSYSGLPLLSAFLAQFKGSEKAALLLERAGLPLRVGEFYMVKFGVGFVLFFVPLAFGPSLFTVGSGLVSGFIGFMLPSWWVGNKKASRMRRIEGQLVDLLGLLSNSLKSGYGLMQSFEFAGRQMEPPIALEIRRMLRDANLGMSAEDALVAMGERIDSRDLDMVLTAINIQRAVGGNLSEILDQVAATMRDRERIRGEIATLTSQQRMTGIVIGGLPVFMFVLFMMMNPTYMSLLFTEMAGRIMLIGAASLEVSGFFVIKRIMAIEI